MFALQYHFVDDNNIKRQRLCTLDLTSRIPKINFDIIELYRSFDIAYSKLSELESIWKSNKEDWLRKHSFYFLSQIPHPSQFRIVFLDYRTRRCSNHESNT